MNESNTNDTQTMDGTENIESNMQDSMELLQVSDGLPIDYFDGNGNDSATLSDGNNGEAVTTDNIGYDESPHVWTSDYGVSDYSVGTGSGNGVDTVTYAEIIAYEKQQTEYLGIISHFVILIFAFLLFSWTEKKINVITNRFANRNK